MASEVEWVRPVGEIPFTLPELLELEEIDRDLYRALTVFREPFSLYGGQVAAQALVAAGRTVPDGRLPHSLHGYYLRSGDASRPTIFRVERDRDGRSFSARRVVAVQGGEVIFNMSASFHIPQDGAEFQVDSPLPVGGGPAGGEPGQAPLVELPRLFSFEGRAAPQPYEGLELPTRVWARCTAALPDDALVHAATLTYLSDVFTGLSAIPDPGAVLGPSLDHAVWFHRPIRLDHWVLLDLVPRSAAGGRGLYHGTIHARDGVLAASLSQEMLFRSAHPERV
ncbi:Acyl-CoA thioesterase [Frankia canadensis]|uniref:Acyl-CoA thioesterase n=1 Tax=Frankia canadensis TaxID=1836972 RepID=A0A2I2KXI5_9ACTN|nr:acyl-CoA thioesterase domain-containing protein [Frankia canadensis]SNQ50373.1 Acyl-CoA thioesterase [Frankia canadensis]SOU57663.1 Acyl-CoA thioesterase [Frankia canadensis]